MFNNKLHVQGSNYGTLKPIPHYPKAFINENGTYVIQYNYIIPIQDNKITLHKGKKSAPKIISNINVVELVYSAFNGAYYGQKIYFKDNDPTNTHYKNLVLIKELETPQPKHELPIKPHPYIEGLEIAFDGSVVYYNGVSKRINTTRNNRDNGKRYPTINIKSKTKFLGRLVYETFIGDLPENRTVLYKNGNHLDLNYKNLLPEKHDPQKFTGVLKAVRGYEDLFINENGTYIIQFGCVINIHLIGRPKRAAVMVFTGRMGENRYVKDLVYTAFVGSIGRGHILPIDGDYKNNSANNLYKISHKELVKRKSETLHYQRIKNLRLRSKIPESDINRVRKRLLAGEPMASIAKSYKTSDMAVSRFKHRYLSKKEIEHLHQSNNIVTQKTDPKTVKQVIKELKEGKPQIKIANKYNLTPTTVCRINKVYIKKM